MRAELQTSPSDRVVNKVVETPCNSSGFNRVCQDCVGVVNCVTSELQVEGIISETSRLNMFLSVWTGVKYVVEFEMRLHFHVNHKLF